ncbi:glycosyl transferase [Leptolyngbya sp. FACHB-711]|uniref:glycosyl transferase n=1 Tax=unclassified Leptolyngbya TaxID=2650499 RepID=UPI001682ED7F|nr:glycosyl transferase [Leptolyngbya sp. FACHB-711]MBD1852183.1 glycosyl transferase [Cyanobacteria bacterium FACHB-502]MBD2025013.1 glycosyl transferase [Leptolyngbya sp. FACHB-711]
MPQPILYAAITNHGFGHATRTAAVIAAIQTLYPDVLVMIATTAPRWLLECYITQDFIHRPVALDIGIIQSDSLTMDKVATLEKLRQIRAKANRTIAGEVNFIKQNRVGLVLADIPPLASAIAKAADVPCWMMSNFGWDFIYRAWGGDFVAEADWIAEQFNQCDRLFRLPFHEPMSAFPHITDVGLTGGSPRFPLEDLRQKFNLTAPKERTVMLTFGGLGIDRLPYDSLTRFPDWQFITFDRNAPALPNLVAITEYQYRPVDLMPCCCCVVSKPGFSTFSEACRLELPVVTITRQDFAESPILLDGLQDYATHRILEPEEFFNSNWDFLNQPLNPPRTGKTVSKHGNEAIAQAVVEHLMSR